MDRRRHLFLAALVMAAAPLAAQPFDAALLLRPRSGAWSGRFAAGACSP